MTRALARLLVCGALLAIAVSSRAEIIDSAAAAGPATGLADSAALRATVYGTPPQDIAPMPERVPLEEINIA
jgi:hypothetical protein